MQRALLFFSPALLSLLPGARVLAQPSSSSALAAAPAAGREHHNLRRADSWTSFCLDVDCGGGYTVPDNGAHVQIWECFWDRPSDGYWNQMVELTVYDVDPALNYRQIYFEVLSGGVRKCLDVPNGDPTSGFVQIYDCDSEFPNGDMSTWNWNQVFVWGDDYRIRWAGDDSYCVDVPGGNFANGQEIWLYECLDDPSDAAWPIANQKWGFPDVYLGAEHHVQTWRYDGP